MRKQIFTPVFFLLFVQLIMAQAPNISYSGVPATYATGSAITTLTPTNTGGVSTGEKLTTLRTGYATPNDIAVDTIGNIYVVNGKSAVTKIDSTGTIVATFGEQNSSAVSIDKAGYIYVVTNYSNLNKYNPSGNLINSFAGPNINGLIQFYKVAIDVAGNIYWSRSGSGIVKMDATGGNANRIYSDISFQLGNPVIDQSGKLYFPRLNGYNEFGYYYITKIDANGNNAVNLTGYRQASSLAIDSNGNMYEAETLNNTIKKINSDGTLMATYSADFNSPSGIAVDKKGNIYVADYGNNAIKKITFSKPYTIQPALPIGLSFDTNTGVISGTPTVTTSATTYTITACNTLGQSTSTITFATIAKPEISYLGVQSNYALNTAMTSLTPTNSGSPIIGNYSIQPTLPAGLSFNITTGAIIGTPTEAKSSTTYTVSASNQAGQGSTTITFSTSTVKPVLSYNGVQASYPLNFSITALSPTNTGSPVSGTYMIIPALPTGLSLDVNTGIISGTPTVVASKTTYTIIAGNSAGTSSATISFDIFAKPNISYTSVQSTYVLNTPITALTPTNTGGLVNGSYFILPDLPTGLNFNVTTGTISGTPTAISPTTTYTIVAGNAAGQSNTTITFAVVLQSGITDVQNTFIQTFPNPVKNILNLKTDEVISHLELLSITGIELINCTPKNMEAQLDISKLSKGTYILKVSTATAKQIVKVIKE
jgi:streptogramin lyase